MADSFWSLLSAGLTFTVPLAILSFILGLMIGVLVALLRLYGPTPLKKICDFYVWVIRGTPLLVQLFLIFYGLPNAGITLDAFPAALIGFAGPRVIKDTTQAELPEGFQTAEFLQQHGLIDAIIPRQELKARLAYYLEFLTAGRKPATA